VLPLRNVSADPSSSEFLVEGIGEALVTRLTELPNLRVIPWITSQRYSDRSRPLRDIAKELDVEVLLVGSFRRLADSLQTTVSLVDGRTGFQRWADDLQQPYGELFSVQRRIAVDVARSVRGQLTGEEEQTLARPAAQSVEAYEYYLRGSYALQTGDKESQDLAFGLFQKALEIDPNLEMAHVGAGAILTARYYSGWGGGVKNLADAEVHFNEALRSNPGSAPARDGLIRVFFDQGKEEECLKQGKEVEKLGLEDAEHLMARANAYHFGSLWDKAIPLYRHVLQIDPANQGARFFITVSNVLLGKYREGIAAGDTLIARYGDDPEATSAVAWAYHCLGDFERARSFYERAYKQDPEAADAPLAIGTTFRQSQQPDRARPEIQLAIKIFENELALYPEDPWRSATLAVAYAMLGNREQVMHEESRLLKEAPDNGIVLAYLGRAHAALGDTQRALELWRRALQLGTRYQIPVCPCLEQAGAESVRRDPGYPQFLKEFEAAGNRLRARY
jgi:tetratricopeptide (TPR) repeat protein